MGSHDWNGTGTSRRASLHIVGVAMAIGPSTSTARKSTDRGHTKGNYHLRSDGALKEELQRWYFCSSFKLSKATYKGHDVTSFESTNPSESIVMPKQPDPVTFHHKQHQRKGEPVWSFCATLSMSRRILNPPLNRILLLRCEIWIFSECPLIWTNSGHISPT